MASRRRAILEAMQARLETIHTAAGFATEAGAAVFLNETPALGPDDPDVAIAMLVGDDTSTWQGLHVMLQLPIEIQALAKADTAAPWWAAEDVLADIKRAMEQVDRTLGGLVKRQIERGVTRTLAREAGSTTVGVSITYVAPYTERWGFPEV